MKKTYIIKFIILVFIAFQIITNITSITTFQIILFLSITISDILFEKYIKKISILIIEFIVITYAAKSNLVFSYAYLSLIFNTFYSPYYLLSPFPIIAGYILLEKSSYNIYTILSLLIIFIAYILNNSEKKEEKYKKTVDNERRLRYELEKTKNILIKQNNEIVYLTEVKERNRISRELHDNVGHSLAGIFMELQVSYKLYEKNPEKSKEELKKSIDSLSKTIELVRDTVHNMKSNDKTGIDYIKSIVDNFNFCPVDFKYVGDFNSIPTNHLQIITENLKEALTNIIKYSKATKVNVEIDTNEKYSRLYIKDNGVGAKILNEGLGISGMKERVLNTGGSISINYDEGFLIVCLIPKRKDGDIFESHDS